jgi:hypothetical protein
MTEWKRCKKLAKRRKEANKKRLEKTGFFKIEMSEEQEEKFVFNTLVLCFEMRLQYLVVCSKWRTNIDRDVVSTSAPKKKIKI